MGYKMSRQKTVSYSPYFLMFGRDPIFPVFHEFLPKMAVILGNLGMKFGAQSVAQDDIILAKVLDFVSGNGLSRYFSII